MSRLFSNLFYNDQKLIESIEVDWSMKVFKNNWFILGNIDASKSSYSKVFAIFFDNIKYLQNVDLMLQKLRIFHGLKFKFSLNHLHSNPATNKIPCCVAMNCRKNDFVKLLFMAIGNCW